MTSIIRNSSDPSEVNNEKRSGPKNFLDKIARKVNLVAILGPFFLFSTIVLATSGLLGLFEIVPISIAGAQELLASSLFSFIATMILAVKAKINKDTSAPIIKSISQIKTFDCEKSNKTKFHDANSWLKAYNTLKVNIFKIRKMRKEIGLQTLNSTSKLGVENCLTLSKEDLDFMKKNTSINGENVKTKEDEENYFKKANEKSTLKESSNKQKVEVFVGDSYDVALSLKKQRGYSQVSVLNMANATSPGGGFLSGSAAQEESLCRRSTLFDAINIDPNKTKTKNHNPYLALQMRRGYNVPEFGSLFSPKVQVFRSNIEEGFAYYKNPEQINVISSAAYDLNPRHKQDSKMSNYRAKTKRKIQMILNTALENNQECVVLGAFGCGAFYNNPKIVADIVKEVLSERDSYQKKMKITFAVISDVNDINGNVQKFQALHGV